jgi:biopolymer transport protein ExbD
MSMNVGNSSGSGEPEVMMDINTTPLIDVMLVLLVMLIITIPIQLHSVTLEMPVGTPPANAIKPEKIQIDIDGEQHGVLAGLCQSAPANLTRK